MNPEVELYDFDEQGRRYRWRPKPTETQEYLWECFQEDLSRVVEVAGGAPVDVFHDGDLCQGDTYPQELVGTAKGLQFLIATANMEYVLDTIPNVHAMRLVTGTPAHTFGEATAVINTINRLQAGHPDLDIEPVYHGLVDIEGAEIDYAHRGPSGGIRHWTQGRQLRYYTESIMDTAFADGEDPPDAIVRAHYHTYWHETVHRQTKRGTFTTEAFLLPGYCGLGFHSREYARSPYRISVGVLALEIEGGELEPHPFWRYNDLRTREVL